MTVCNLSKCHQEILLVPTLHEAYNAILGYSTIYFAYSSNALFSYWRRHAVAIIDNVIFFKTFCTFFVYCRNTETFSRIKHVANFTQTFMLLQSKMKPWVSGEYSSHRVSRVFWPSPNLLAPQEMLYLIEDFGQIFQNVWVRKKIFYVQFFSVRREKNIVIA